MARRQKIAVVLKKEISRIIHDELKDPRLGFVTVTGAEVTADLRQAKIFFSVLGKDEDYKRTKEALDSALGFIRRLIGERIKLRFTPQIIFQEDHSAEYSIRIQKVLDEINSTRSNPAEQDTSPTAGTSNEVKELDESKKSSRLPKKK